MAEEAIVLICGSRTWHDVGYIDRFVGTLVPGACTVIHGAAPGADSIAGYCANARGLPVRQYPADWSTHGKAAGFIRNQQMLDMERVCFVVAFTMNLFESKGTFDMARRGVAKGLSVMINPSSIGNCQQVLKEHAGNYFICREDAWINPWRKK